MEQRAAFSFQSPDLSFRSTLGGFWPIAAQLWREMACFRGAVKSGNDSAQTLCKPSDVARMSSNYPAPHCQYRYPYPRRSGPFGTGPTPLRTRSNASFRAVLRNLSLFCQKTLELPRQTLDSASYKLGAFPYKKGSKICKNSNSFSPQRPSRHFRHVLIATLSVAPQALSQVLLSPRPLASIPSRVPSLVALQAGSATKSRPSVAKKFPALGGPYIPIEPPFGVIPNGGFACQRAENV